MSTTDALFETLDNFSSISLEELNATSSFLDRINTKYVVHVGQLPEIISHLKKDFSVLTIEEKTVFSYDNVYMDTKDYLFYEQHESGNKSRTKIRTRNYMDAENLAFFEYKHKAGDVQRKHRFQCPETKHGKVTAEGMKFYHDLRQEIYPNEEVSYIFPSLGTRYQRFTLCGKDGSERLTIDFAINLIELRGKNKGKIIELPDVAIIEGKSLSHECLSHKIMAEQNIPQAKACSKYGLGIYYHGHAKTWNKFQNTIDVVEFIKKCNRVTQDAHLLFQSPVASVA